MSAPPRPRRAFSLPEVLVSVAIFAISAVVLGSAYVNVLGGYQRLRAGSAEQHDISFARSLVLAEPQREVVERGGEMRTGDNGRLQWRVKVEETTTADLFRVAVEFELAPPGTAPTRTSREEFLLLRPTWSDPGKRDKLRAEFREQLARRDRT